MNPSRVLAVVALSCVLMGIGTSEIRSDDCGTDLIISSLSFGGDTLSAGVENPGPEPAAGFLVLTINMGGSVIHLAISLEVMGNSSVDVEVVFLEPFALMGFGTSACEGSGISDTPSPVEIRVVPRDENGEEQSK